ncbi:MAG: Ig-like domain-containing protein [Acidobacteria bacterium]|nr:Ig-like domain-containing protein [Acidobacteriota bacterium]
MATVLLFASGCGGSSGGASTAPAPSVTSLSITTPDNASMFAIGQAFTFTAAATMSNGATQPVSGTWGSDAPAVATASGNGDVRFVGAGEVTVFVDYAGVRGTKRVRGIPNFQGTWVGSYLIAGCEHSGAFAGVDFCREFPNNRVLPLSFVFTQTNDSVSGTASLGTLRSNQASGPIAMDGTLALPATYQDGTFTLTESWVLQSREPGRIAGRVLVIWRAAGASGEGRTAGELFNVNRTSTISVAPPAPGAAPRTIDDLVRAVRQPRS